MTKPESIYAHSEGHTKLAFSIDGRKIYTAGGDNAVRCFNSHSQDRAEDIQVLEHHNEPITCLVVSENFLLTGSEDRSVVKFSLEPMLFQATITRCTLPIRFLALQPQSKNASSEQYLAVASDELNVKLVGLDTGHCHYLTGLRHPPASISFHPGGNILVAISSQGTVLSWDLAQLQNNQSIIPQRSIDCLGPSSRPDLNEGTYISYHPLGKLLALPARTEGEVQLLRSSNLSCLNTLKFDHTQLAVICAWSVNGQYLATATHDGFVSVWRTDDLVQCLTFKHDGAISGLEWSPTQNLLALTDENGSLVFYDNLLSSGHGFRQSTWSRATYSFAHKLDEMFGEEEAQEDLEQIEDIPNFQVEAPIEPFSNSDPIDVLMSDSIGEDIEILSDRDYHSLARDRVMPAIIDLQPCFQPGSTIVPDSERQFLAYNTVGYIVVILGLNDVIYNVVFHNKDELKDYTFSDSRLFTQASLDERGALFAIHSQASKDEYEDMDVDIGNTGSHPQGEPALVAYRPHGVWGNSSSWEATLPHGEDIQVVATTPQGPAVTTTKGFLRIFSSTGIQKSVVMCPSPTMLTMASNHDENIMLIYHHAAELNQLRLRYALFNVSSLFWVSEGFLTIAPNTNLEWAGFSSEGTPAIVDSNGVVQILAHAFEPSRASWYPVLKINTEEYMPFGISVGKVFCLQIGQEHPNWLVQPRAEIVPWHIPAATSINSDGYNESQLLETWLIRELEEDKESESMAHFIEDRLILQLFKKACQSDQTRYANELATLLHTKQSKKQAISLAQHIPLIADRLQESLSLS